ncbi:MAG: M20 family metallo-hydrolase [Rikenellaceae bacterium]|nr:M20 family metallo-hydrolase [Rikenellaceae bacterium]
MYKDTGILHENAVALLARLIETPSFSREEEVTAGIVSSFLSAHGVSDIRQKGNNVWALNRSFDPSKPTILLNSHHDTVKPNPGYTRDPFKPEIECGRLYGLGSNDAGASVVSLCSAFLDFYDIDAMAYNLCLAITAEEEISGHGGVESILTDLPPLDFAIVGEPTGMQMAIAERGLVVLDCLAEGRAGHAAREEGENAIYKALEDINWLRNYRFPQKSDLFGEVKMSVTVINAGSQHNVVPAQCSFTVDIRVTDKYTNEEVVETVRRNLKSRVTPRSVRLKPSFIDPSHRAVRAGLDLGLTTFGSPTTSDQALLDVPSMKIGPGESTRSHSADEYVRLDEIREGIEIYTRLLGSLLELPEQ